MSYKNVIVSKMGATATVTMARPHCGNALSLTLMTELIDVCEGFKYDTATQVIIVKGQGKHFCVGADLKDPQRAKLAKDASLMQRTRASQLGRDLITAIMSLNQITIAGVQGAAAGGGACIASACDFRIGSDDCKIGYPEVKLGMNLSWGAVPLCFHLIGPAKAKRMIIGGELESAELLERWGFLDEVVGPSELDIALKEMADFYVGRPALAAQMIKRSVNALQTANSAAVMHMDGDQFVLSTESDEYKAAREGFVNGSYKNK